MRPALLYLHGNGSSDFKQSPEHACTNRINYLPPVRTEACMLTSCTTLQGGSLFHNTCERTLARRVRVPLLLDEIHSLVGMPDWSLSSAVVTSSPQVLSHTFHPSALVDLPKSALYKPL